MASANTLEKLSWLELVELSVEVKEVALEEMTLGIDWEQTGLGTQQVKYSARYLVTGWVVYSAGRIARFGGW